MRAPPWIDLPPDQWPPEARIAMELMAKAAERRLAREKAAENPEPKDAA